MIRIAIADDRLHTLKDFILFIEQYPETELVFHAQNGHDLILQITKQKKTPDIIFVDINMPYIDGIAATYFLKINYPSIKVIGLSVYDDAETICYMMNSGAYGYVLKADPQSVFPKAMHEILSGNKYIDERLAFSSLSLGQILMSNEDKISDNYGFTPRERTFIILNCTTLSYEQIAEIMFVETKTVQTYFDRVSKKLNISSRQALTLFSIQNGLAKVARLSKTPVSFQ